MDGAKSVAIMVAAGMATGLLTLGLLREAFGIAGGAAPVGASVGVVGALPIARRRLALRRWKRA